MDCLRPTSDMAKESPYGCLAYFTEHLNLPTNGRQRKPKDNSFPRRERMVCPALSMGSHRGNPLKVPGKLLQSFYATFVIIVRKDSIFRVNIR